MSIIGIEEAAELLQTSTEHLRRLAKSGKVPAAKPGRKWIFIVDDLHAYIRSQYGTQDPISHVSASNLLEKRKCHYTNEAAQTHGLLTSRRQAEKEYAALLKLA